MKEINDIIDRLRDRKEEFESSMQDISRQQSEIDDRRARVEGSIREIDYVIEYAESEE
jgi:predicted  nucleic acid-binding Zn-ribbon protein